MASTARSATAETRAVKHRANAAVHQEQVATCTDGDLLSVVTIHVGRHAAPDLMADLGHSRVSRPCQMRPLVAQKLKPPPCQRPMSGMRGYVSSQVQSGGGGI
jgi:hypothetical protein